MAFRKTSMLLTTNVSSSRTVAKTGLPLMKAHVQWADVPVEKVTLASASFPQ